MTQIVVFVLHDPTREQDLLAVWQARNVPGITKLDSYALNQQRTNSQFDDLPLLPSLADILRPSQAASLTFFTLVPDHFDVDGLIAASEKVLGDLNQPNLGVAFCLPVTKVWGVRG